MEHAGGLHRETPDRPAPPVVFEIDSPGTWTKDVQTDEHDKPAIYGRIGVKEYFTYDSNTPQAWLFARGVRLRGWRYAADGTPIELQRDRRGWLRSEELQSFLVPDGREMYLYDFDGNKRLTYEEGVQKRTRQERQAEIERERIARQRVEEENAALRREIEQLRKQQKPKKK
jgi:Putative restriction endonuclease